MLDLYETESFIYRNLAVEYKTWSKDLPDLYHVHISH